MEQDSLPLSADTWAYSFGFHGRFSMLETISWISLVIAVLCAMIIGIDEFRHPQKMWIMNIVWPVTALYFSVLAVWAYYRIGRKMGHNTMQGMTATPIGGRGDPSWEQTLVSATHCGAGCTLGDIIAEFSIMSLGLTLLGSPLYAEFAGDLLLAWLLGIAFQYFAIKPMHNLSAGDALTAAIKADTLSILSFEVGLFAWMAVTYYVLFPAPHLMPNDPTYWLMMQIGMVIGFFTSYPMNRWLILWGIKEVMD
jgi:putative flippase GtrA